MRLRNQPTFAATFCVLVAMSCSVSDECRAAGAEDTAYLKFSQEHPVILGQPYRDGPIDFALFRSTQEQYVRASFTLRAVLRKPQVAKLTCVREAEKKGDVVKWLADVVRVSFPGKAEIMAVTCNVPDLQERIVLTNALADTYLDEYQYREQQARTDRIAVLEKVVTQKENELRNKYYELRKITKLAEDAKTSGKVSPSDEMLQFDVKTLEDLVRELRRELEHAKINLKAPYRVTLGPRASAK